MPHHHEHHQEDKTHLASPEIYEVIAASGHEELNRPTTSLAWSAIVAGICMCFSLFAEGFIYALSGSETHNYLLENLGYTVGFIIVILGRFQLFTENTITVILPLLEKRTLQYFLKTMRLWGIVLLFNMVGTFLVAVMTLHLPFFTADHIAAFLKISLHAVDMPAGEIFFKAIPAGFLIAALVWMMPNVKGTSFFIVMLITYLIAIGDFAHIIAGSVEAFLVMLNGSLPVIDGLRYLILACLGNIIGGTGLFTLMAYAQIRKEI